MTDLVRYLSGAALYGDDFTPSQISAWFADEAEGYAGLGAADAQSYTYGYHALNQRHGYRHLEGRRFPAVLGFGSAYGDELKPVVAGASRITIVDPSAAFTTREIDGKPVSYVRPAASGELPLEADSFDLITCLGVLHHIPNVSFVTRELARVLKPGGVALIREPIVSMGDWRQPRRGLTKRERGIPLHILRSIVERASLRIERVTLCAFPATHRCFKPFVQAPFNSAFATQVDHLLSTLFAWNVNYHPTKALDRLRPTSAFIVAAKPARSAHSV